MCWSLPQRSLAFRPSSMARCRSERMGNRELQISVTMSSSRILWLRQLLQPMHPWQGLLASAFRSFAELAGISAGMHFASHVAYASSTVGQLWVHPCGLVQQICLLSIKMKQWVHNDCGMDGLTRPSPDCPGILSRDSLDPSGSTSTRWRESCYS